MKENIRDADPVSGIIDAIKVRAFDWKGSDAKHSHWFVAQELAQAFPLAVAHHPKDDTWSVDATALIPLLVKELQSVRARLAKLEHP
jgi:hypothetical protein